MPYRPVFVIALATSVFACNSEDKPTSADAPETKVVRGVDTKRIPVPNHGPDVMAGKVDKSVKRSNEGKFEAKFHDKPRSFTHFSPGVNAAIYAEKTGVGRLMVTAAHSDKGFPRLELRIGGIRLDKLELPVTFPLDAAAKTKQRKAGGILGDDAPTVGLRYLVDGSRAWSLDPEATKKGENTVTLSSLEGRRLKGSLEAHLLPKVADMGEVIEIEQAEFEIDIRLQGVEPGGAAAAVIP